MSKQVGGSHYKNFAIEPIEFINKNNLAYAEGNVIKYVCRHKYKGKLEDIKKAIHYLEIIIERDYEISFWGNILDQLATKHPDDANKIAKDFGFKWNEVK